MTSLKTLGAALALMCILGTPVVADCPVPGETHSPPCSSPQSQLSEEVSVGATNSTPPLSDSVDIYTLAEIALERLLLF